VIKEYFEEVRADHSSWQQMLRRKPKHKVIQQCTRLALGVSANETYISYKYIDTKEKSSKSEQLKELLTRRERNG
jgi:hypothetical protein